MEARIGPFLAFLPKHVLKKIKQWVKAAMSVKGQEIGTVSEVGVGIGVGESDSPTLRFHCEPLRR